MEYNNPFIKVTWKDSPENFTAEKLKRVKTYFQQKYNTTQVKLFTIPLTDIKNTKLQSLDISENILDENYQKTLMMDFIKENGIDINWKLIDRLDNRINEEIKKNSEGKVRYNRWFLKRVAFSNFLSYGEDNVIDFTTMDGITVIESNPKNFGGKSTGTIDLLKFLFFNSTTKTKTNAEVFNKFTDKDKVVVKGEINIDNEDYVIERICTRKKGRTGDYTVSNKLEFYKKKPDGTIENLTGEQRRETEQFIASAIGTEEDFLSTILTTGYNLEELIESKPTARGQILTRFLGLDSLKQKEEVCREIYNGWSRTLVSNTYNVAQLESANDEYTNKITEANAELVRLKQVLEDTEVKLRGLELRKDEILSRRNNNIDAELLRINPTHLQREINELIGQKKSLEAQAEAIAVVEPSEYYLEEDHDKVKNEINEWQVKMRVNADAIKRQEKLIKQLEEGSVCPTCNRALDEVDHTEEIHKLKEEVTSLNSLQDSYGVKILGLQEKEKTFVVLKKEYDEYERNKLRKAKCELETEQKQNEIEKRELKLANYESNKQRLEDNAKIDSEVLSLKTKIETANADIRQSNVFIERENNNIEKCKEKIATNLELIKKIKTENDGQQTFKVYLTIFGKNGISKIILKNMIPLLNQELHRLLIDSCHFNLELNINDKNELEFLMIDSETRVVKPLSAGSGYERTISSLALRSVLTKISSLPKPNIVVMDEVFGKVADENLEAVGEFFKKIKKYFEHIFVISHNPLIRNWSDNLIMIKKEDNVSSIDYISTNRLQ